MAFADGRGPPGCGLVPPAAGDALGPLEPMQTLQADLMSSDVSWWPAWTSGAVRGARPRPYAGPGPEPDQIPAA
ncbi:hypothetical protein GCM10010121_094030 [Streptomyces brasiliensis]|uniref:Uncharacterized protein n=1 Tax=Streptomyces brasiliensis TaxID=1954 RepID=A0A917UMN0_9ACTN|nr:hypothetical protein GCM10010121_094030 [Streptomyces brasiliensis]